MATVTRPALPTLKRGDTVILVEAVDFRQVITRDVVIEAIGPKWLTAAGRRFLLADQGEGVPGRRIGYGASFATPEQRAYDVETLRAQTFLRDVAGLEIRRDSPFYDRDMMVNLVGVLRELLP